MKNEKLAVWLGDGTGSLMYNSVLIMLQTLLTFVMSVFSVVKTRAGWAKNTCFILVLLVQCGLLAWHIFGQPNDRLKAMAQALGATLEIVVISLTFASSLLSDYRHPEHAVALGTAAPSIMLYVTLIPLGLEMYDALFLPIRKIIKNGKADGASTKTIVITLLFLPLTILLKVLKVGGSAAGNINKVAGVAKGTSKKAKVVSKSLEGGQSVEAPRRQSFVDRASRLEAVDRGIRWSSSTDPTTTSIKSTTETTTLSETTTSTTTSAFKKVVKTETVAKQDKEFLMQSV